MKSYDPANVMLIIYLGGTYKSIIYTRKTNKKVD